MGFLGDLSFPLYLVHVPVICSVGSAVYLSSQSPGLAILISGIVSIAAAIPLLYFNLFWVERINAWTSRLMKPPPANRTLRSSES